MKRHLWVFALVGAGCGTSSNATEAEQAVFTNPDFESDPTGSPPSGWTIQANLNPAITDTRPSPQTLASLNLATGGVLMTSVVGGAIESQVDPDIGASGTFRYPKYGTRAALVNYGDATNNGKNRNVNALRQTMTVTLADVDPFDDQVHVRFAFAPVLEDPGHTYTQQPYYFIRLQNVTTNTTIYQDFSVPNQPGVPWKAFTDASANSASYVDWALADISPGNNLVAVGDQVELLVIGAGCSRNGHWGRIYLDSFGENIPGLYTWANGPQLAAPGGNLTYRLNYRNGGQTTTSGTTLELNTPPNTTFVSTTRAGCTTPAVGATGVVSCPLGTLAPGADGSFTVTLNVAPATAVGTVINNGNYAIAATGVSPLLGSRLQTTVSSAALGDVKATMTDGRTAIGWGQATSYTAVISNAGPSAASSVAIADTMPTQLTGVTWTCAATGGASCTAAGSGNLSDTIALPAGATATYTINGTIVAGTGSGSIKHTLTATVGGSQTDPDTSNNTGVDTTQIGTPVNLTVTKATAASLGTIRSTPGGLTCGTSCTTATGQFNDGSQVVLDASPATGATFVGWSGACTSTASSCTVTMAGALGVTARFAGPPATATITSGAAQSTRVSTAFPQALTVQLVDSAGTPIPNATVTFTPPSTGASASLSATTAVTDATGVATITATANATPGSYVVTATATGLPSPAQFQLVNFGPPASVTAISGAPQSATVGTGFALPLVVEVRDAANQLLGNAAVTFTAPSTGASATPSPTTVLTGPDGRAQLTVAANTIAGSYAVAAAASAGSASFALTNVAGAAATVSVVSGDGQSTPVTTAFAAPFVARVTDSFGNPVAGVAVAFAAPGTGASATLSTPAVTDGNGQTSVTGTAKTVAGSFAITASAAGAAGASFPATATPGAPATIAIAGGNDQRPTVNTAFGAALAVVVRDAFGNLVPGATVAWTAPASGASASVPPTATTGSDGVARITPTAGTVAGSYAITATVNGHSVPFTATNLAGAAAAVAVQAGTAQSAVVNTAFAQALVARVTDAFGNPVAGATVSFAGPGAGATATVSPTSGTSDASGQVSTTATAGTVTGAYSVTATVSGVGSTTFALTNTAGAAAAIAVVSGTPQSATVNTAFAAPLVVEVRDAFGNLVPGATVAFTAPGTGASATFAPASPTTSGAGRAQTTATAGTARGAYSVTATAGGQSVTFALTNSPGAATAIAVVSGSPQHAAASRPFADPLIAIVRDGFGNPVPGATVTFAAPSGATSATLSATSATTLDDGTAQVTATARTRTGSYDVTASIAGNHATAFALTNDAGPVATLTALGGGGQAVRVATAFPAPLRVEARDDFGNLIPGAAIAFTAPATGATATVPATATTLADGTAQVAATAGNVAGTYQVTASSNGITAAFQLTNLAGPASKIVLTRGDHQATTVLQPFDHDLELQVTDDLGNPIGDALVTLHAPDAPGPTAQLADIVVTTGADGVAGTSAIASRRAGAFEVTAAIPGATASFHLTSRAAAPATVRPVAGGSPQVATVRSAFAVALEVIVEDAYGNPCAGVDVEYSTPPGGATAEVAAHVTTDAAGHASSTATASGTLGSYFARATTAGAEAAAFELTNLSRAPAQVIAQAGSGQAAIVDHDFAMPLDVLVLDASGNPVASAIVAFAAPDPGPGGATGVVAASAVATSATGHALVAVRAGTVAGTYVVTASTAAGGAPVQFTLTNQPDAAVALIASPLATPQQATVLTGYAEPLSATAIDAFGNAVPGATVAFSAPATGATGTLSAASAVTDAAGRATVTIVAGSSPGPFTVTAATAALPAVGFELTNLAGGPARLSVRRGTFQHTAVGTAFAQQLVAHVDDHAGTPRVGVAVTFAAPGSGATAQLAPATAFTDANGDASALVTAGDLAGDYLVVATTPQAEAPVAFALTNDPGAPFSAALIDLAQPQTTQVGHGFLSPLGVVVLDAHGNRVPGAMVSFAAPGQGASARLSALTVATGRDGRAASLAIANPFAGAYVVTVTVGGLATTFELGLTNTAGAPSGLVAVSGGGQHAMATTAFGEPVTLRVVDELGNPVPGAVVTLTTPTTGPSGALSTTTVTSDADGLVSVTLVANAAPGAFAVTGTIPEGAMPAQVLLAIDAIPTTTTVDAPAATPVDQPIDATITVSAAILVAAGEVELLAGDRVVGKATLDSHGTAVVTGKLGSRGHLALSARFAAQGSFGASTGAAEIEATRDSGRLTGAGTDCNAGGSGAGLGVLIVLALGVIRRRRLALVLVPALATTAAAQSAGSRAIARLHPAAADSAWFAVDSVEFAGHRELALSITGDYAHRPLVIYNADESRRVDIVRDQLLLHFGGSLTLYDRFRISANAPLAPYQDGDAADYNGMQLPGPTYAFGDVTVAGDVRIAGRPGSRLRAAVGVRVVFPTGSKTNYTSDGIFAGDGHALVAGTMGRLEWGAGAQLLLRESTQLAGEDFGSELRMAAAVGARLAGGKLIVGPELMSVIGVTSDAGAGHPLELGLGLHYRVRPDLQLGAGASVGLVHAVGTPEERGLLSLAWWL